MSMQNQKVKNINVICPIRRERVNDTGIFLNLATHSLWGIFFGG